MTKTILKHVVQQFLYFGVIVLEVQSQSHKMLLSDELQLFRSYNEHSQNQFKSKTQNNSKTYFEIIGKKWSNKKIPPQKNLSAWTKKFYPPGRKSHRKKILSAWTKKSHRKKILSAWTKKFYPPGRKIYPPGRKNFIRLDDNILSAWTKKFIFIYF